jgi:hypothetical protein
MAHTNTMLTNITIWVVCMSRTLKYMNAEQPASAAITASFIGTIHFLGSAGFLLFDECSVLLAMFQLVMVMYSVFLNGFTPWFYT